MLEAAEADRQDTAVGLAETAEAEQEAKTLQQLRAEQTALEVVAVEHGLGHQEQEVAE
jgi:hypothetical protein